MSSHRAYTCETYRGDLLIYLNKFLDLAYLKVWVGSLEILRNGKNRRNNGLLDRHLDVRVTTLFCFLYLDL